jgi:hypothetical protein
MHFEGLHMSVWNQHDDFLAQEVAELAITDASESGGLLSLMHKAYDLALRETETKYLFITDKIEIDGELAVQPYRFKEDPLPENGLYSVALETYKELLFNSIAAEQQGEQSQADVQMLFDTFRNEKNGWHPSLSSQFEIQRFSREEIDRWLRLCGLESKYVFVLSGAVEVKQVVQSKCNHSCWATQAKLIAAFEDWGLKEEWFRFLNSHEWLKKTRMQLGVGGRRPISALFCPYSVMVGLTKNIKGHQKGEMLQFKEGKQILRSYFPKSYDEHIPDYMED